MDLIYKLNDDIFNRSENIQYAKTTLEYITKFIEDTIGPIIDTVCISSDRTVRVEFDEPVSASYFKNGNFQFKK